MIIIWSNSFPNIEITGKSNNGRSLQFGNNHDQLARYFLIIKELVLVCEKIAVRFARLVNVDPHIFQK